MDEKLEEKEKRKKKKELLVKVAKVNTWDDRLPCFGTLLTKSVK